MSVKISLNDKSIHDVSVEFITISNIKDGDINHINSSLSIFNKIKTFGDYYLALSKKDKKLFENPDQLYNNDDHKKWCVELLEISHNELIELINQSYKLNIKPLIDLCCYQLSQIVNKHSIIELRSLFDIRNDFSSDENDQL